MKKAPLFWATPEHDLVANALGYNTHNKNMKKHGEPFFDYTPDAEIALSIIPANKFTPIPGKFNVLFTMWELLDVPPSYIEGMNRADALIVPCSFCKDLFSKHFPKKKIWVCNEGVDEEKFKLKKREFPKLSKGEKFRFLWVGAPNPRKGHTIIQETVKVFANTPSVEVYMKTTMPKLDWWGTLKASWKRRHEIMRNEKGELQSLKRMIQRIPKPYHNDKVIRLGKFQNIILDTRKLPLNELIELYESAHCFILPHLGEGWGLTLSEAMATGAPCISVAKTGCADFFDDTVGYDLKTDVIGQDISRDYDLDSARAYVPRVMDLLDKMQSVMIDYKKAAAKGVLASHRIRERFTWKIAGKRLRQVIDEIAHQEGLDSWKTSPQ